jgi:hypothetical protein
MSFAGGRILKKLLPIFQIIEPLGLREKLANTFESPPPGDSFSKRPPGKFCQDLLTDPNGTKLRAV